MGTQDKGGTTGPHEGLWEVNVYVERSTRFFIRAATSAEADEGAQNLAEVLPDDEWDGDDFTVLVTKARKSPPATALIWSGGVEGEWE